MESLRLAQIGMGVFWLWSILCLLAPRFLFFAHPKRKKRMHGLLFPFLTSLVITDIINTVGNHRAITIPGVVVSCIFLLAWLVYLFTLRSDPAKDAEFAAPAKDAKETNKIGVRERWRKEVEEAKVAVALEKQRQKVVCAYSNTSDREYTLKPYFAECTCPDWQKKRSDAYGPFALCKHLVSHYQLYPDDTPDDIKPFQEMFLYFAIDEKGMPYMGEVNNYGDIEGMPYIFTGFTDRLPWVNVYTQATGSERYGYNAETKRWAKGEQPPHAKELEVIIDAAV